MKIRASWLVLVLAAIALVVLTVPALAQERPGEQPGAAKTMTVRGKVAKVQADTNQFTLRTADGKELMLHLADKAKIRLNNQDAQFRDLREGMDVTITYETRGGKHYVTSITSRPGGADQPRNPNPPR